VAKYMENAFYATKVMFCNEFFDIARRFGVDYNELREVWLADPRISRDHTFVYPQDRGFGGKCLSKDTAAIIAASEQQGYTPALLRAVMAVNAKYRREDVAYPLSLSSKGTPRSATVEEGPGNRPGGC
jgi:UDP-glucose 6-dehydrogenase